MNELEKMKQGLLYNSFHDDLKKAHQKGLNGCQKFSKIPFWQVRRRERILNKLIPSSKGKHFDIFTPFHCEYGINIEVGYNCFCNFDCVFLDVAPIKLGNNVFIGAKVVLATPMHPLLGEERISKDYPDGFHDLEYAKPITIKDNVWICSNATICGGVTIGENAVIAAGAVVTNDVPKNCLVGGVPAKVIRELGEDDRLNVLETYLKNEIPISKHNMK